MIVRRKNKKYNYEPRFYKSTDDQRPFEIRHKFDDQRTTIEVGGIKDRFNTAVNDYKSGIDIGVKRRLYIIIAILVLLFLWIIDFDLSIFKF